MIFTILKNNFFIFVVLVFMVLSCTKTSGLMPPFQTNSDQNNSSENNTPNEEPQPPATNSPTITGGQIPNSDFQQWYAVGGYYEPGKDAGEKIWATGNAGFKKGIPSASEDRMPTRRIPNPAQSGRFMVEMTTREVAVGNIVGKGIAAGNIFTGSFYIDPNASLIPNNHQIRPFLGIGFTQMPVAFSFQYQYKPGAVLKNGNGSVARGADALFACVILENRNTKPFKRLAVGWFVDGAATSATKEQQVDLKYAEYGQAPQDLEDDESRILKYSTEGNPNLPSNRQQKALWGDTATIKPTHIIVSFSSSNRGDDFVGAPGSQLILSDFKLIYENEDKGE